MSALRTRLVAGGVAALLLATTVTAASATPTSAAGPALAKGATVRAWQVRHPGPRVPKLVWRDCGDGLQCATARVPLDYDHPRGRLITLALARLPSGDPQHRIGSLFVNPGGPGGSARAEVRTAARFVYAPEVLARFDIVGMDPRGVGGSTPVRCFNDQAESNRVNAFVREAAIGRAQLRQKVAAARALARRCAARNGELLQHLSTANVARDLDLLRRAVGDRKLTYDGISYGTYLGATYAAMFPRHVRALVLDGNVDPGKYRSGRRPPFVRQHGQVGASDTLRQFFRLCAAAGPSRCAFAKGGSPSRKFAQLAAGVRRHPITLPDGRRIDFGALLTLTFEGLYQPRQWAASAQRLQDVYAAWASAPAAERTGAAVPEPAYDNTEDAQLAITCSETANPSRPGSYPRLAARLDRRYPYAGSFITWLTFACTFWTARDADRYRGSFRSRPAYPALVLNNRHDPITPERNAFTVARLIAGSRVLTTSGWGHTVLTSSGPCDAGYRARYLVHRILPARGANCPPGPVPFAQP